MQQKDTRTEKSHHAVLIIFLCIAIALTVIFIYRNFFSRASAPTVRARTIVPVATGRVTTEDETSLDETIESTVFIPLAATETLLSSVTFDFDGDNLEDQVVAIRKSDSPNIFLIVAIYVQDTNNYIRGIEINTGISRVRTFSYGGMDVTGTHRNALVYQGVRDDNMSVMRIYRCNGTGNNVTFSIIGDFESDGAIFIQQGSHSNNYDVVQSTGSSFVVWVYSSDATETDRNGNTAIRQIQTEYEWSENAGRYMQKRQRVVAGSTLAAAERARILDGTVETFSRFLSGLWYRTTNESGSIRYLYFDYDLREIIFLYGDSQEVYSWQDSNLYRNGIYLTSSNSAIPDMRRRFDVTLLSGDTVQMHIIDDVRTFIREATLWDGEYRKMPTASSLYSNNKRNIHESIASTLRSGSWNFEGTDSFTFGKNSYIISSDNRSDEGAYSIFSVGNNIVIQFRSNHTTPNKLLSADAYKISFRENESQVFFSPVTLMPNGISGAPGEIIVLTKN